MSLARRDRAIEVLAVGGTQAQAAEASGVCRTTVYRWTNDPEFSREVERRVSEIKRASQAVIHRHIHAAEEALVSCLTSPDDRVRLSAGRFFIEKGLQLQRDALSPERLVALARVEVAEAQEDAWLMEITQSLDKW